MFRASIILFLAFLLYACASDPAAQEVDQGETAEDQFVTLYTHRHYDTDKDIFTAFAQETGIEVRVVKASADELIQKMKTEGEQSPADLLLTVDAGRLVRAEQQDLLQAVSSTTLEQAVPSHLRDDDNKWFGLTKRARVIVYDKERVQPEDLSTYEGLTDAKWEGKLLIRSSSNIYNQSLLASIIANNGPEAAKEWAGGVVKNFARPPKGNDRDQVKAILAHEGEIAVVNTYYLGLLLNSEDAKAKAAGENVSIFFPNQEGRGTHINVSGIGLAKFAPHRDNAIKLMEYLVSKEVQETFASSNYEYPVNPAAATSELLQSWGAFKEDQLSLSQLGELNQKAVLTFDEVSWP
ncbi:MAG: Fe(3+) ABC transporter substrate-binding protein [Bacteroidota bacterium]